MHALKTGALALALAAGMVAGVSSANAAPVPSGVTGAALDTLPIEQVQYYGYGGGPYGYGYRRRHWAGPRYGFRPPVVCRVRYTPYGPRRVCFRRY